jgi:GDP-D-mannose dehydratase
VVEHDRGGQTQAGGRAEVVAEFDGGERVEAAEVDQLIGNPEKARRTLGWQQKVAFRQLVEMMVDADLARLSSQPQAASTVP